MDRNYALLFIKPHANTKKTQLLVSSLLEEQSIEIIKEGELSAAVIDEKKLIDQHYYSIASNATLLKPTELPVPVEQFQEFFGLSWQEAIESEKVFNAVDACKHLGLDADTLNEYWNESLKEKRVAKFGGGFYCGQITLPDHPKIFVFNGFFMSMRHKYVKPGASIYYYSVSFSSSALSWSKFRTSVIGSTDPTLAHSLSLRGRIASDWRDLGLHDAPTMSNNGIHASASPLEGLAERKNWLNTSISEDPFGMQLLNSGIAENVIQNWCFDPQAINGGGSIFDIFEDLDSNDALAMASELALQESSSAAVNKNSSSEWDEAVDENGNIYYFNNVTHESTWQRPNELIASSNNDHGHQKKKFPWVKVCQDDGSIYYFNEETSESTWEVPDGFPLTENDIESAENIHANASPMSAWVQAHDDNGRTYYFNQNTGESTWEEPSSWNESHVLTAHESFAEQQYDPNADEVMPEQQQQQQPLQESIEARVQAHPPLVTEESFAEQQYDPNADEVMPEQQQQQQQQPLQESHDPQDSTQVQTHMHDLNIQEAGDKSWESSGPSISMEQPRVDKQLTPRHESPAHIIETSKRKTAQDEATEDIPDEATVLNEDISVQQHQELTNKKEAPAELLVPVLDERALESLIATVSDEYVLLDDESKISSKKGNPPETFPGSMYLKRELSCIKTLVRDCNTEELQGSKEAPSKGFSEGQRRLQLALARSQQEASERKSRSKKVKPERSSTLYSQRSKVWCNEMHKIISKELHCDCSITCDDDEGLLVTFWVNKLPQRLSEEDVTKFMTKMAVAGYGRDEKLRMRPDKWAKMEHFVEVPEDSDSCKALIYGFFVPRVVVPRRKLDPTPLAPHHNHHVLSQSAPSLPTAAALTTNTRSKSQTLGKKSPPQFHSKNSKHFAKLKPFSRKRKDMKKTKVRVVHVAPGYDRIEQYFA